MPRRSQTSKQAFGGVWTEQKLRMLGSYIPAYLTVFNNRREDYKLVYIDAFAGTGRGLIRRLVTKQVPGALFAHIPEEVLDEVMEYIDGSAKIALDFEPGFDHYVFIEKSQAKCRELEALKPEYPGKEISVLPGDANAELQRIASHSMWRQRRPHKYRAVVFIDPFGMQLDFDTLRAIARTGAMDVWLLVPLNQATNRLLAHDPGSIQPKWRERLTRFFGTDDWFEYFYKVRPVPAPPPMPLNLFDHQEPSNEEQQRLQRVADLQSLAQYINSRLKTVFPHVSDQPRILTSDRGNQLYMLCFASANSYAGATAVRIADSILRNTR